MARRSLLEEIRESEAQNKSGSSVSTGGTAKQTQNNTGASSNNTSSDSSTSRRKSLLEEIWEDTDGKGLNKEYYDSAMKNGGGFGASSGGIKYDDDGNGYLTHDYSAEAAALRQTLETGVNPYRKDDRTAAEKVIDRILGTDATQVTGQKTDWGKLIKGLFEQGANKANARAWEGVDFLAGGLAQELRTLGETTYNGIVDALNMIPGVNLDYIGGTTNAITDLKNAAVAQNEAVEKKYTANANTSRAAQIVNTLGTETVAAIPAAVEAIFLAPTAAANAATATTQGLNYAANLAQSGGLGGVSAMAAEGFKKLTSNPQFWTSYLDVVGDSYNSALEDGMSQDDATIYALVNSFINATIEIGGVDDDLGGIQNLPYKQARAAQKNGKMAVVDWFKDTVFSEGWEEVRQGAFERGLGKVAGNEVPWFSTDMNDTDAVINPWTAAQEFTGGAVVGALLGGGQTAVNAGINAGANAINSNRQAKAYQKVYGTSAQELVNEAKEINPESKLAEKIQKQIDSGKTVSGKDLQALVEENEKAAEAAEGAETSQSAAIKGAETQSGTQSEEQSESGETERTFIRQVIDELGVSDAAAQVLEDGYIPEVNNAQEYAYGVREAYKLGQMGLEYEDAKANAQFVNSLDEQQFRHAYELGAIERQSAAETEESEYYDSIEQVSAQYPSPADVEEIYRAHSDNPDTDINEFAEGFKTAYEMGKSGASRHALTSKTVPGLSETQRGAAYRLGKADAEAAAGKKTEANTRKAKRSGKDKWNAGTVKYDGQYQGKGTVKGEGVNMRDVVETLGLNDTQRTAYRAISSIAEATGINVVFYKSEANADGRFTATQGEFSRDNPGTIYIDLNAGLSSVKDVSDLAKYTMLRTFSHEFVHFIENWDAVKYNELRRVVFAEMEKNGVDVDTLIRSKVREGLDYDAASREAVAESLTEVLPQSSFAETLYNEHKSLYEQIADKLKQFIEDIKAYFAKVGHDARNVYSSAVMRQIDGVLQYSEDVLKIFDEAAKNAVENYQLTLETVINEPTVSSEQTVTETASEAESESKTESKTETKTEPQAETKAETQAETQDNESIRSENGFTVSRNPEYNSVEVSFDEKPSDKVRDVLKAKKFRWNGKKRVWYGKSVTAEEIRGLLDEAYASEKQTESAAPVSEQAEPQGQTIIPTAKQSEMPQTEQQTESKAEEPVQQAEETVEAAAETVSESAEEAVETQAEEESAAEIIEKAEEGKLREETPPKAETEEAKAEIKREIKNKGVKFPTETTNYDALAFVLENKELGIETITLPGEVNGFNKEQRAYIVKNLIEGYHRGEKIIKLDIPFDGKLTVDGKVGNVLFILGKMKATVTQEVEFSKGMLKILNYKKNSNPFVFRDSSGQKYITDGSIVLPISESAYDYALKESRRIITTGILSMQDHRVGDKIVGANYRKVTETPKEVKVSGNGGKALIKFSVENGETETGAPHYEYAYFDKEYISYFDGYGVEFSIDKFAKGYILKAVDENGNVKGYALGILMDSQSVETQSATAKLKAFAEKKKSAKAGKIERKNENESNKNENNKRGVLESDADGAGASRLLDELQDGDVQQSGEQRGSAADTSEQGRVASRDSSGESSDARSSGGEGSSKVNDIRRDGELTAEEKQTKDESLRETVKEQTERQSPESPKGRNFVIGQSLELPNGEKARFRANVDALKLVRKLETEGRNATPAEQKILSKYVGWGGLANAFGELKWNSTERKSVMTAKKGWESEFEELRGLVNDGTITEEEYKLMQGSTANAHYTSIEVIKAMYYGLEKLGFQGGRMLEPAAGVGNFIGAMPTGMSAKVKSWTAVELDSITGLITKHLYPNADVRIEGFEKANIPDGYMDVAISNVPFGKYGVTDRAYPNRMTKSIHNYFFAKALDKVRPGGIVMFITSSFTMNSADSSVREYIMKRADLLGAIRLPNTAFTGNAGTQVVTDILILKKREAGTEYAGEAFEKAPDINPVAGDWNHANINEYFINHPDMVLGTAAFVRGMYGPESLTYNPLTDKGTLGGQINAAFGRIKGKMDYTPQKTPEKANFEAERANKKPKKGSLTVKDGKVYRNENGKTVEESANKDTAARVAGLIEIRDAYNELANAELQGLDEKTIKAARKKLNKLYDEFVKKYGYINNPKNAKVFANDPDSYSLLSLEKYQKPVKENKAAGIKAKKESAEKADIFTQSTIRPNRTVTHVDSVEEGLIVSINRKGEVDAEYIAELTGKTAEEVTKELVESRRAFKTKNGGLEAPDKYLSGNVRAKLREAEALAKFDKDFENNVEELKRVVPKDILPEDIFVQPGAQWIPDSVYADFIAEALGGRNLPNSYRGVDVEVSRTSTGEFKIQVNNSSLKSRAVNTQELGTPRRTFLNIMESLMLGRSITVFDKITDENGSERRVVNKEATAAAKEKAEKIQEKFREWLWADKVRKDELAFLYNETFNALATPKYDGANMTVNGLKAGANLRPHQLNAVQRIISSGGNTLLAHRVGAGKTLEMAAAAMKLRELGIVKKPVFVVPKALVSQWGAEFKEFFPAARLIVADENSFTPGNRRIFANRIANNDFDACIMSYEQFEKIPLSKEEQARFYQQQIDEMLAAVAEAKAEKGGSLSVKAMVAKIKSLEKKLDSLNTKAKDTDNITFEGLGIDSLFVDEAQNFKNLMFSSHMQNVAGLGNSKGSQRAFDLYAKIRYLQRLNSGRGIVFATATPVMNSMTEMYTMQRYLQTDMLESLGLKTFDAWAKQFGEVVNRLEVSPSGTGFRIKATFSKFRNLNELQLLFRSFADVLTHVDGLKIPKMKGGAVKTVECELSEFQKSYIEELAKRSENIKNVDPRVDNMLKITSDGRKASYTQKMIDPSLPFEPGCKIYRCCDNVIKEYKESSGIKGTQIIFCDLGTPKKSRGKTAAAVDEDANVEEVLDNSSVDLYSEMKNRLVEMGIPANEIAFIHDADTNEKRLKLFEDVNEGRVRVLIGSTSKMGVGMNAQKRVVAIHHLDAPHRPGDIEQRDGRAFRQKNINDEVSKYVYITVGSYDTKLWDNLKRKAETIDQVMNGDDIGRSVEDTGEVTLSAAEIMALSSGSPLIMEQVQLTSELEELRLQKKSHNAAVATARKKAQEDAQRIPTLENAIAKAKTDIKNRVDTYSEGKYSMTVGKQKYTDKKEAGKALAIEILAKAKEGQFTKVGEFAGFELQVMKYVRAVAAAKGSEYAGQIVGAQSYPFEVKPFYLDSPTHLANEVTKKVEGIDAYLKSWQSALESTRADLAAQEKLSKAPFAKQAELDAKTKRFDEVMAILNPQDEQTLDDSENDTQYQERDYLDDEGAIQYQSEDNSKANKYSYEWFVSKPDMIVTELNGTVPSNRADIVLQAQQNAASVGKTNENGVPVVYVDDIGKDVLVSKKSLVHGLDRRTSSQAPVLIKIGNILKNSIRVNELNPRGYDVSNTYVLVGAARGSNGFYVVSFVVNRFSNEVAEINVLYSANAKKESAALLPKFTENTATPTDSTISIANLLDHVNNLFPDILPESVLKHYGYEARPEGNIGSDALYQQRSSPLTNREVLELAASGVGFEQLNEAEKNALEIFGKRLDNLAQLQEERVNLGREYMKQQFTKGGSRQEAAKTLNAMKVLDAKIKETENEVIGLENKEVLKKVLAKARTVVEAKEKLQGQEALRRYRIKREESAAVRKYRTRVRNDVEKLRKWLVSPSNKDIVKHVPAEIQKSVADFLSSINMMSKTALRTAGLETTKADDAYIKSMRKMRNAIKSNVNAQGLYSGYADLPEDFFEKFDALIAASEELMKNNSDGFVVNLMSASELKQLSITLRTLTAFIKNMNTLHSNAMFKHAADAGEATIAHLNHLSTSKMSGRAYNFMRFGYMRPSYAFEHFGEGGRSIEHEFREGQATQAHLAKRIIDFAKSTYTGKEVDAWSKEIKTFTLSTGETVSMPVTHLMSLYCLNKRKQALTHIYGDGIRVANFKDGNKTVLDDGHTVTFKQVEEMLKELTPRQIAVAEALQKFMSTEAAQWGNYVSMIRFDVEQFTEQNYFPINSDGRYLSATADESPNNAGLYALLNSGFTKELKENAGNRIILYNIFDVFANHTASMAQYRAFALPMLDALKWFNYKNESSSVRARLSSAFGAPLDERAGSGAKGYAEDFVINLLRAYNGTAPQGDPYDSFGTAALHRYNGAAIAFNARVIIQQPMAITRAAMILSPKKLAEGLKQSATHMKALAAEMEKYSGIAAWKSLGFYDTNISRGLTDLIKQNPSVLERVMDVGTAGAEQADRLTWAAMWYAAKSTVNRSKYETEEDYFKAVTELFEEVIYKTQVVDSILTKSEFLRAKGGLARQAGSFMSEPSATMSMLADAAFKYTDDLQRGYSREAAWRRNGKFIIKTAGVYAIGQVMLAAVQAIIDAWRDDDEYSDEWFENYFTKYLNAFKGNVVEELMLFGKIPYVSEIYEVVKGYLDSAGLFDNLGLDIYGNDVSSGLSMYLKYISKAFETVIDMISGESTNYTAYSVVYNLLRGVSNLTGIPVGTAWREVQDLWNNTVGFISPRLKLETYQTSLERTWREYVEPSGLSKAKYQALLEKADSVFGDGNGSYTQDEVGAALQAGIEDGTLTETQANAVWRSKWHKENNKTFDEWKSSSKKKSESASSGEATVTSAEYDVFKEGAPIYKSAAKEAAYSVWETQLQGVMSIEEYTELFSDADADGNGSVKQDEMGATLMAAWQNGKLSFEQCEAIWHSQWNSAKSKTFAKWLNG